MKLKTTGKKNIHFIPLYRFCVCEKTNLTTVHYCAYCVERKKGDHRMREVAYVCVGVFEGMYA